MSRKQLVFICSPFRGDIERNTTKARGYCRFASIKGAVPFAPHLHNVQFLDENIPEERDTGIKLGVEVLKRCDELWCFGRKITEGMRQEIIVAREYRVAIKYFNEKCEEITDELFNQG